MSQSLESFKKEINEYSIKKKIDNKKEQNIVNGIIDIIESNGIDIHSSWEAFNEFEEFLINMCYFRWLKLQKYKIFGFKSMLLRNLEIENVKTKSQIEYKVATLDWRTVDLECHAIPKGTVKRLKEAVKILISNKKDEDDRIKEELNVANQDLKKFIDKFMKYIVPMNEFYELLFQNKDNTVKKRDDLFKKCDHKSMVEIIQKLRKKMEEVGMNLNEAKRLNSIFWLYTGMNYQTNRETGNWEEELRSGKIKSDIKLRAFDAILIIDSEIKYLHNNNKKETWEKNRPIILRYLIKPLRSLWTNIFKIWRYDIFQS